MERRSSTSRRSKENIKVTHVLAPPMYLSDCSTVPWQSALRRNSKVTRQLKPKPEAHRRAPSESRRRSRSAAPPEGSPPQTGIISIQFQFAGRGTPLAARTNTAGPPKRTKATAAVPESVRSSKRAPSPRVRPSSVSSGGCAQTGEVLHTPHHCSSFPGTRWHNNTTR